MVSRYGRQICVAIFCQRSSTESDHRDRLRRGIEQQEPHHLGRIVENQPVRIVGAHYALHKGPICEEASHSAQFENERGVQSALLDQIWIVTVGTISFKMTLIAVEVVEVIEKMIKLASHPIVAMKVLSCLGSNSEERSLGKGGVNTGRSQ